MESLNIHLDEMEVESISDDNKKGRRKNAKKDKKALLVINLGFCININSF